MYRLMIVDDEKTIRDGLCCVIPWHSLGFEVACVAGNGIEALQLLQKERIDVILTDVEMPEINGLNLVKQAGEMQPGIRFVVISGYSNFEYAQQSVELHAENYILKPIEPKQIGAVFTAVRERLDRERKKEALLHAAKDSVASAFRVEDYRDKMIEQIERGNNEACAATRESFLLNLKQLAVDDAADMCRYLLSGICDHFDLTTDADKGLPKEPGMLAELTEAFCDCLDGCIRQIGDRADQMTVILCKKTRAEIDRNYADGSLSLRSIAEKLNVSYGYLSSIFTEYYHTSPKAYLIQVRMKRARELLLQRELKIYEIAEQVGYANSRYFTDAFRRHYGVSPSGQLETIRKNKPEEQEAVL